MKLQKRLSRKLGEKIYNKWVVTIPPEKVKELKWREGEELEALIEYGKLVLKPKKKAV